MTCTCEKLEEQLAAVGRAIARVDNHVLALASSIAAGLADHENRITLLEHQVAIIMAGGHVTMPNSDNGETEE
jgi:hypothetical protein